VVTDLRIWFLVLAFVSIGLEFRVAPVREAGWRPVGVFAAATAVNLVAGLALATWLFSGFVLPTRGARGRMPRPPWPRSAGLHGGRGARGPQAEVTVTEPPPSMV
jgi:hypothetical protein